jgi:hypothetical protein
MAATGLLRRRSQLAEPRYSYESSYKRAPAPGLLKKNATGWTSGQASSGKRHRPWTIMITGSETLSFCFRNTLPSVQPTRRSGMAVLDGIGGPSYARWQTCYLFSNEESFHADSPDYA